MLRRIATLAAGATVALCVLAAGAPAQADTISLKLASGHPPGMQYVDLFANYLAPELKKRVAARTEHKVNILEAYSGAIIKNSEALEALQSGLVDIAGSCYCFEPSNLPLHSFPVYVPFGTSSPLQSLGITRDVYAQTPELTDVFEKKWNQRLLALIVLDPYEIISKNPIEKIADLKGMRIGAAGPNLPWVAMAGAVPVQTQGAGSAYTNLQTGVVEGLVSYPSAIYNLKLTQLAKNYTKAGFGAVTWLYVHMNLDAYKKLPPEVQQIVDELGRDFEMRQAMVTEQKYAERLRLIAADGVTVRDLSPETKKEWATLMSDLPNEKAKALNEAGYPGTVVLNRMLDAAEAHGYQWPVRYKIN
jgi:TRAP-type C4-dicarboxylate transport system substrate-binding protein